MTRLQIMQEGLRRAGRPDLLGEARFWLNLFLESMYRDQDFHWMRKQATLATTNGLAVPTDYLRAYSAVLVQNGNETPFHQFSSDEYDALRSADSSGPPSGFFVDPDGDVFRFHPTPSTSYTWKLRYYYMPTLPDPDSPIGDQDEPLWKLDPSILIQAIYVRALEYDDDTRFDREEKKLDAMLSRSKINSADKRAGSSRMKLGKSFRRRL